MLFSYDTRQYEHFMSHGSCSTFGSASAKRKSRDAKREKSFDGGFSKGRLDI